MKILKTISIVMFWTIGYRILGFLRELIIAEKFGSGIETDAYFIAQSLPNLIIEIFAIGALSSAIIPIFIKYKSNKKKFKKESEIIIGNFFILSLILLIILLFFNKLIVDIMVPGFSETGKFLTYNLTKISLIVIPILIITDVLNTFLNSYGNAESISFSHFIYNFSFLLVSLILYKHYGIYGFVYGIVFSSVLRGGYVYYKLKKIIGILKIKINFKNKNFIKIIKLLFPIMLASISIQINFITDRVIGSTLEEGSISYLTYSNKLIQLPLGIILGAAVLTTFPTLAEYIENNKIEMYQKFIKNKMELIFIIMGMISSFIFCFPEWIISIIFERGVFTLNNVMKASEILKFYSFSVLSISFITLFQKIFYSFKITKIPAYINILSVILNIILNITLSKFLGLKGIAIATMIANFFNVIALFLILKLKFNIFNLNFINTSKIIFFNVFIIFIGNKINFYLIDYLKYEFIYKLLIFILMGIIFLGTYIICLIIFYPYKNLLKGE